MDSNIRITTQEIGSNRGRNFLVGVAVLVLLWHWWHTGALAAFVGWFSQPAPESGDGYGSVTGYVIPLVIDIVITIGSVATFLMSGVWAVVKDVAVGLWEGFSSWTSANKAITNAATAASDAATQKIIAATVDNTHPTVELADGSIVGMPELASAIQTISDAVDAIKAKAESIPDVNAVIARISMIETALSTIITKQQSAGV